MGGTGRSAEQCDRLGLAVVGQEPVGGLTVRGDDSMRVAWSGGRLRHSASAVAVSAYRRGERPEPRERAFAGFLTSGVGHERRDRELAAVPSVRA